MTYLQKNANFCQSGITFLDCLNCHQKMAGFILILSILFPKEPTDAAIPGQSQILKVLTPT
jgi:hypothetical protein